MSRRAGSMWTLIAALAATAGCRVVAYPLASPLESVREGRVAVEIVPDPNAPLARLEATEEYRPPRAGRETRMPEYPAELIGLALPPAVVGVRIVIGAQGRVIHVAPSPVQPSTPGPHSGAFDASVRAAVSTWRFSPPSIRSFRPGEDRDGDGKPDYSILEGERPVQVQLDLRFLFEIVEGQPRVSQQGR